MGLNSTLNASAPPVFFARRIILLSGDADAQDLLADALAGLNPKLAVLSLDAPIYDCIFSLGMLSNSAENELSIDPTAPFAAFPSMTNRQVFDSFYAHVRRLFGDTFLADRALNAIGTLEGMFDCFVITGIADEADLQPFLSLYPPDELLHVVLKGGVEDTGDMLETIDLRAVAQERHLLLAMKAISPASERRRALS